MRIGIFTLPLHVNYGGILQAYALQTVLERMGHEVKVINRYPSDIFTFSLPYWKIPLTYLKRIVKKIFFDHETVINKEFRLRREFPLTIQNTMAFCDKYIHSYYIESEKDIKEEDFDAIVVGSDQIWRPTYYCANYSDNYQNAFLAFAKNWDIKRYAYAASFGVDEWEGSTKDSQECANLAKKFDAISVREDSGVNICKNCMGVEAVCMLDPTMILQKDDYISLVNAAKIGKSDGDMFCYILDNNSIKSHLIQRISNERNLSPFYVMGKTFEECHDIEQRIIPPVEKWLRAFMDAKLIVTDSFHGMAFSIIFGKPFVAIGNRDRGLARMESLLRLFELEDHLICEEKDYDAQKFYSQKSETNMLIDKWRKKSISFLSQIN